MKKYLVVALALALIMCGLAACSPRTETPSESQEPSSSVTPEPEPSSESPPPTESEPAQTMQTAAFSLVGNNGQATELSIQIPDTWTYDGDKLMDGDRVVAKFGVVLKYEVDTATFLSGLDDDHADALTSGELDLQGLGVRYYHYQTENADGTKENELRYWVCADGKAASISFYPAFGVGIETQREEFETYLATLEM